MLYNKSILQRIVKGAIGRCIQLKHLALFQQHAPDMVWNLILTMPVLAVASSSTGMNVHE